MPKTDIYKNIFVIDEISDFALTMFAINRRFSWVDEMIRHHQREQQGLYFWNFRLR